MRPSQDHAGAPEADEQAEPVPAARHQDALDRERGEHRLVEDAGALGGFAPRLQRQRAARER